MNKLLLLFTLSACPFFVKAQSIGPSTLNAAGGSHVIGSSTFEYSVGEIATGTYSGASLVVTQGVLQPKLSSSGIAQNGLSASEISVYPNPVQSTLFLQPYFSKGGTLTCVLTDAAGKTVAAQNIQLSQGTERQEINMAPYAAGQYILSVTWSAGGAAAAGAYKIQKIK